MSDEELSKKNLFFMKPSLAEFCCSPRLIAPISDTPDIDMALAALKERERIGLAWRACKPIPSGYHAMHDNFWKGSTEDWDKEKKGGKEVLIMHSGSFFGGGKAKSGLFRFLPLRTPSEKA